MQCFQENFQGIPSVFFIFFLYSCMIQFRGFLQEFLPQFFTVIRCMHSHGNSIHVWTPTKVPSKIHLDMSSRNSHSDFSRFFSREFSRNLQKYLSICFCRTNRLFFIINCILRKDCLSKITRNDYFFQRQSANTLEHPFMYEVGGAQNYLLPKWTLVMNPK